MKRNIPIYIGSTYSGESTRKVLAKWLPKIVESKTLPEALSKLSAIEINFYKCQKIHARRLLKLLANLDPICLDQPWDKTACQFELLNPLSACVEVKEKAQASSSALSFALTEALAEKTINPGKEFKIALTFPGEKRRFVKRVAYHLGQELGDTTILYDENWSHLFARPNLDVVLPNLYRAESELICVFLCPEYWNKKFCQLEWRHIRQLIQTTEEDRIMFLSFGQMIPNFEHGVLPGDGCIKIGSSTAKTAMEVAACILKRWASMQKIPQIRCAGQQKPDGF